MCNKTNCCQKPDQLKSTPEKCSPDQVRKCHGDVKKHPCTPCKPAEKKSDR